MINDCVCLWDWLCWLAGWRTLFDPVEQEEEEASLNSR
jgi:hypothetical protein